MCTFPTKVKGENKRLLDVTKNQLSSALPIEEQGDLSIKVLRINQSSLRSK